MKIIAVVSVSLSLSGCAYLQAHIGQVALVGTVAGAVAASEQAAINAIELKREITK